MRDVTKIVVSAFMQHKARKVGNTESTGERLYLHGNCIARWSGENVEVTNAGWRSATTKDRLNGIPGVSVYQKRGEWHLNGEEWGGEWKQINPNGGEAYNWTRLGLSKQE